MDERQPVVAPQGQFGTTHWSEILSARNANAPGSGAALERLCRVYWHPLYFFARRKGSTPEDAQDSVQGFFEKLLSKDYLGAVEPEKGRFRTFLLSSFSHFRANEWDRRRALKRGGGLEISLDGMDAKSRYSVEPADLLTPEKLFDRGWAETVVNLALEKVGREYAACGDGTRFEQLRSTLFGNKADESYAALGEKLGLSETGVKTVVRRMRLRFAAVLRDELAQTLANPAEVDTEMRYLLEAFIA